MALQRPYCVRGHREGYIHCLGVYSGETSYRKINDPEYKNMALYDGWVGHCFITKKRDIEQGKMPCFDECRMWCLPNDCSVFDAKKLWWSKKRKHTKMALDSFIKNENKIAEIIGELSDCTPAELLYKIDKINQLVKLLPYEGQLHQYLVDRLIDEGEVL